MPRMNGYELVRAIKSLFETREIPVIMFSGANKRQHIKELDFGLADFLDKPVSNWTLLDAVGKALGLNLNRIESRRKMAPPPRGEGGGRHADARAPPIERKAGAAKPGEEVTGWDQDDELLEMIKIDSGNASDAAVPQGLEALANDSPLIGRVNQILMRAIQMRASDIHVEPQESQISVRVRVDGALRTLCTLPIALHPRLVARLKIMANLSITERRLPQDGQIRATSRARRSSSA